MVNIWVSLSSPSTVSTFRWTINVNSGHWKIYFACHDTWYSCKICLTAGGIYSRSLRDHHDNRCHVIMPSMWNSNWSSLWYKSISDGETTFLIHGCPLTFQATGHPHCTAANMQRVQPTMHHSPKYLTPFVVDSFRWSFIHCSICSFIHWFGWASVSTIEWSGKS